MRGISWPFGYSGYKEVFPWPIYKIILCLRGAMDTYWFSLGSIRDTASTLTTGVSQPSLSGTSRFSLVVFCLGPGWLMVCHQFWFPLGDYLVVFNGCFFIGYNWYSSPLLIILYLVGFVSGGLVVKVWKTRTVFFPTSVLKRACFFCC